MTADKLLSLLFNAGVVVSISATVLALGMSYRVAELLAPLRRAWLVVAMVVVNALLVPAAAYGIGKALPISSEAVVGLTLAATGAASAAGLKASQLARRSDLALAVSIVVVLQLVNLVAVPVWAGAVVSGVSISTGSILGDLLLLVLAPLAIGLVIRARYAEQAKTWPTELAKISNLALALALVAGISVNWHAIVSLFGSWVLLASVLTAIVGVALGALVGRADAETCTTTGLVSGLRFGSLGLIIIGTQLNGNAAYLGPALVFSLIDLIVVLFLAVEIGRHTQPSRGVARPQGSDQIPVAVIEGCAGAMPEHSGAVHRTPGEGQRAPADECDGHERADVWRLAEGRSGNAMKRFTSESERE
jgi:BASS family bile acid:Na+ symporter